MASNDQPISKVRQRVGDGLLIAGCVLMAMAAVPQAPLSALVSFGAGIILVAVSHLFCPFRDQLARFRGAPIAEPSHELKQPPNKAPHRKDAI